MLKITTLASGSSGNCALVSDGTTHILVDAGISARRICKHLKEMGMDPAALTAILVTHEHTDHISGIATLTKQRQIPVYATHATGRQMCYRIPFLADVFHGFSGGDTFPIGSIEISTFSTPHDSVDSVGYALCRDGRKVAVVTDLGHVTDTVRAGIAGAHVLLAEANHDVEWVNSGDYPYYLKERILGNRGHLSNESGGALVLECVKAGAHTVLLAHLSNENNTPVRAYDTVSMMLERHGYLPQKDVVLAVAPRSERGVTYNI